MQCVLNKQYVDEQYYCKVWCMHLARNKIELRNAFHYQSFHLINYSNQILVNFTIPSPFKELWPWISHSSTEIAAVEIHGEFNILHNNTTFNYTWLTSSLQITMPRSTVSCTSSWRSSCPCSRPASSSSWPTCSSSPPATPRWTPGTASQTRPPPRRRQRQSPDQIRKIRRWILDSDDHQLAVFWK